MQKLSTVDVIIPFHRVDKLLVKSINSVINSPGILKRLILVDDRTNTNQKLVFGDNTFSNYEYINTYGIGPSKAVQVGLSKVNSPYIAFQDSDDISLPHRLSYQVEILEKGGYDISISGIRKVNEHGFNKILQPPMFIDGKLVKISSLLGSINSNSTWVVRRDVLSSKSFRPGEFRASDWATTLMLDNRRKICIIPERLYLYRMHENQLTRESVHKKIAFQEIYPLWDELSNKLNLPKLSFEQAARIAAPWAISRRLIEFPIQWCREFLKLEQVEKSVDLNRIKSLMFRRFIQGYF